MAFLWLFLPLLLILGFGLFLSFRLTRRFYLSETRSPAEYGLPFETITFKASDGITLRGWWIPVEGSKKVIIQLHGHSGSMDPDIHYAPAWHAAGYNVLMFDFRGHGRSEGKMVTLGYLERRDVQGAVAFVQGKGMLRIGLLGFSMGGITALLAAPICPQVAAVVDDGGPVRLRVALYGWGEERHVPRWIVIPLAYLTLFMASLRVGANMFQYEPLRWVAKIAPRPILFIQGDLDQYVPAAEFDQLAARAQVKEMWRLPQEGHVTTSQHYPEEYRKRVIEFFNRVL